MAKGDYYYSIYHHLVKHSLSYLKKFDKVIAVSNNTKRDILKYTDCPSKKIIVLHNSVEKFFNQKKINKKSTLKKYNIPSNSIKVLIVGSSFYKNHQISLKVLEELKKKYNNIYFLKIGNKFDFKIKKNLYNSIIELPKIKREEISNIYKVSDAVLFPSIYEGFGLPLLEAIKSGVPIVCSNLKVLKEIVKTKKFMAHPNNFKLFSKLIIKILENHKEREKFVQFNLKNVKIFDEKIYICESNWSMFKLNIFFLIKLIFGFIIPFVFVVICIIRLILFIKRKNVSSQFNQTEEQQKEAKELNEDAQEEKDALEDAKEEEDALDVEGDEIDYLATYDRIIDRAPDNVDIDSLFSIYFK